MTTGDDGAPDVDATHATPMTASVSRRAVSFDRCGWTLIEPTSRNARILKNTGTGQLVHNHQNPPIM
jgi:1,6-anhydro-N-acetylmuramate kinase